VTFEMTYARGTVDPVTPAAFLMSMRDADLNLRPQIPYDSFHGICSDPPAWWQLKKKKIRDWTGAIDARSTRLDMINIFNPFNSGDFIKKQEPVYADIHQFVLTVESPKYPFAIDPKKAERGATLFVENCARCHGTYGAEWTYPNKVVPLDKIGTDPLLAETFTARNLAHINESWLTQEKGPDGQPYKVSDTRGYQAPPLDGIWATAPYFHNASVPTIYHVLNSKTRPKLFTRSYRTDEAEYDRDKLGWKATTLEKFPEGKLSGFEMRKIYDTTQPGRRNTGHTFGDELTEDERLAVIEYLKTF
jgi:mono/diheme cytochrome c family protein